MSGGASPSQAGASSPSVLDSSAGMSPSQQAQQLGCPNSVLRIIIENMIYPITLDVLHQVHHMYTCNCATLICSVFGYQYCEFVVLLYLQIFSKYGSVLRIVTFSKNRKLKCV